jgi:VanZ family protein
LFGLSADMTWNLIVAARKLLHLVFYGCVTAAAFASLRVYFKRQTLHGIAIAISLALLVACCDEWRQSMMPRRQGTVGDVALDGLAMVAVGALIWFRAKKSATAS